ncbi:DUF4200 domain family [Trichomonas vaginalis G3]|uniref:DUF4200 domain family n=1 Tax=Trichomonas vaginalis (strain ATCC PRA-98 / G3) TaxID=412133 RepID=UPI0021E601C8|nr:DUF4200 domain family [Trichomonas vaginalis G3]KAI5487874.1 DUF4200 domain family [Trichomonas vaginalis G3]
MQRVLARRLKGLVPESQTGLERLIDKKRASYDLQVELDRKKQEHAMKMRQFKARAEELEQMNLDNQKEVVSKDKFIRDNCNKRQRYEESLMSEEVALAGKQVELNDLIAEMEKLKQHEVEIKTKLQAALPYKKYLDSVFERSPEIVSGSAQSEVQGIVNKYNTLKEWRGTLQVRLVRSKRELMRLRDSMSVYDESSTNSVVEIDYQIKRIAQEQEASFKEFGRERHLQETMSNQQRDKAREAALIRLTIENIYQKTCKFSELLFGRKIEQVSNLTDKFSKTRDFISDLLYVDENIKSRQNGDKEKTQTRRGLLHGTFY